MNEQFKNGDGIAISSEEDIEKVKEQIKEEVIEDNTPNDQQKKLFEKALEEASMPVTMTDEDFKLGEGELDIRGLSKKNKEQMFFRQGVIIIATLRQCMTSLVDLTRLMMVELDHQGVEDIVEATDDVIEKVAEKNRQLREFIKTKDGGDNNA